MRKGKVIELLKDEILNLYPGNFNWMERNFTVHCSDIFAEHIYQDFLSMGFLIPAMIKNSENEVVDHTKLKITNYSIPMIGSLNILPDMEQGYKIEKI